jgi:hypothetical protein
MIIDNQAFKMFRPNFAQVFSRNKFAKTFLRKFIFLNLNIPLYRIELVREQAKSSIHSLIGW